MTGQAAQPDVLRAMLEKADGKLAAAREAMRDGFFGEAASCSYYAAFHAASAVLAQRGLAFSSHAQVMGAFNREFVKTAILPAETTRRIQRLFEDRQTADYDWKIRIDEATASADVTDAECLVATCREYLARIGTLAGR